MTRPTLKLTRPVAPAATTRTPSSRALRARRGDRRPGAQVVAAPVEPAPAAPDAATTLSHSAAASQIATASRTAAPAQASSHSGSRETGASHPGKRRAGPAAGPAPESGDRRRKRSKSGAGQRAARDARAEARGEGRHAGGGAFGSRGGTDARRARNASPQASSASPRRPHERRSGHGPSAGSPAAPLQARPAHPPAARHENPDDPRLSKRMSELGLCSRREADEWIRNGWVRVDGKVVDTLGTRVPVRAQITIEEAASHEQGERVTILLHKPIGYVSGQAEDGYTPASVLITPENRWSGDSSRVTFRPAHLRGLAPAGRLDIDSTGLLVFTQDGRIAKRLVGRDSEVEKEYLVRVEGALPDEGIERLRHGLVLDGVKLRPAKVSWQNEHQLRFVLREGRKRQIRRMCELVGLDVTGLKRVRSGSVALGALPVGQWRYLRPDERF
jgi:23S rRNA pseudouridine2604 synthase